MKSIEESIGLLLNNDQALTIQKTEEGFIIAFSDMEEADDESLIFVPEKVLISPLQLREALDAFYMHHQMTDVRGYQA